MRQVPWRTVVAAALVVIAVVGTDRRPLAAVGEGLVPVSISATVTMESLGLTIAFTGDTNGNAVMTPQVRVGGSGDWTIGHPCVKTVANQARCSLFFLTPNTTYSYQVQFSDPDGTSTPSLSGTAATRATSPGGTTTRTLYVAPNGSDSSSGGAADPFRTIQRAADAATPGTRIVVASGTYRESVLISNGGTAAQPIIFESAQLATDSGADPATLDGSYSGLDVIDAVDQWTPDPGYPGGYVTTLTIYAPSDQVVAVYRGGERLYAYSYYPYNSTSNYANYVAGTYCPGGGATCFASRVAGGYFYDAATQRLYVKLPDSTDPDLSSVHVIKRNATGLRIRGVGSVVVRGFRLQHFNTGVLVSATATADATDNWLERNLVQFANVGLNVGGPGEFGTRIFRTVVQDNVVRDTGAQWSWPWAAVKQNDVESTGIGLGAASGTVIQRNAISDVFNGIDGSISWAITDEAYNPETDIANNTVTDPGDDGIELDGAAMNVRVWGNRVAAQAAPYGGQSSLSVAPVTVGPAWIIRNTLLDVHQSSIKSSYGLATLAGRLFFYHNTLASGSSDLFAVLRYVQSNNLTGFTATFRNNLLIARGTEGPGSGSGLIFEDAAADHTNPPVTFDLDYDDLYSSRVCSGTCRRLSWLSNYASTLAAWSAASGQELRGLSVEPRFISPDTGDYSLQADSPVIDRGVALSGINNGFAGAGPDLGAVEYVPDTTPPTAVTDLQASG